MSVAAPAAALVCPICDLTDPSAHHGCGLRVPAGCFSQLACSSYTPARAETSTASPTFVPVPWASTSSIVSGVTPAAA